jgi:hypothetical protein
MDMDRHVITPWIYPHPETQRDSYQEVNHGRPDKPNSYLAGKYSLFTSPAGFILPMTDR